MKEEYNYDDIVQHGCFLHSQPDTGTKMENVNSESRCHENEKVEHPSHYNLGDIECIDAIKAAVAGLSGIEAFCAGNVIKYMWRWKHKNGVEDLSKAGWYLRRLAEEAANG